MSSAKNNSKNPRLILQCSGKLMPDHKPMLPLKTLDIINRRRYVRNTQYYFTTRKHAVAGKKPEQHLDCFRMPRSEKLLSYLRYTDRKQKQFQRNQLRLPVHLKDNLRFAATRNISTRLYTKEPPSDIKAVVEIHPEFYSVVEGRPLRAQDDIKIYVRNICNYVMNRQQIGYRRDMILQIDKSMTEELKEHTQITLKLKRHITSFQRFLTEDYKMAQSSVAKSEKVVQEMMLVNAELLGITSSLTILNNIIFKLDSIRNILKVFRRYLLFVSPLSWRQQYDETLQGVSAVKISDEFVNDDDLVEYLDVDKIVELVKIELRNPNPANMYFKQPEEMIYLFRTMELQSREYLIQLSKTDVPFRMLRERIKQLKKATSQELDYFQYSIDQFKGAITREMFNENYLQQKFYRILADNFFESIASPDTLKLGICINYVYEQVFGKCEEGFANLRDPMRILEVYYEDYNLKLDSLDFKVVNQARNENFAHDLSMMMKAYKAQRELKSFTEMTNAMNRAFLAPAKFKRPGLNKFIDKKTLVKQARALKKKLETSSGAYKETKKYKVTPEQRECLHLFTNWCDGTNPAPFLKDYETYVKPVLEMECTKRESCL